MFYEEYLTCDMDNGWEAAQKSFSLHIPDNFNFAYDVIDRYAAEAPEAEALVWCDDKGEEKIFTFGVLANKQSGQFFYGDGNRSRRHGFAFFAQALRVLVYFAGPA